MTKPLRADLCEHVAVCRCRCGEHFSANTVEDAARARFSSFLRTHEVCGGIEMFSRGVFHAFIEPPEKLHHDLN